METKTERILIDIKERFLFLSELGVDFILKDFSSKKTSVESTFGSLQERILHCKKCPLSISRKNVVVGEGNLNAELMFVGEAPGREEDIQGKPFVGKAGQLLTKIINAMHFNRREVYITNIIKCRPPENRNPNIDEIEKCKGYLFEQLRIIKPKVIVTLGNVPSHFFIQSKLGITALRGDFCDFNNIKVMPTFHPSYLVRSEGNKLLRKMVWEDMQKVMAFLGKK